MKAVVLAAGRPHSSFPDNSKQKVLYHVDGEVLLERLVHQLREAGVEHVRVVVGYGAEGIKEFNRDRKLGLELVYNPQWDGDPIKSFRCGTKDLNDDALIVFGDILVDSPLFRKFVECKAPLAWIRTLIPWGRIPYDEIYRSDIHVSIVKIAKEYLTMFEEEKAEEYMKQFNERLLPIMKEFRTEHVWNGTKLDGVRLAAILVEGMYRNGPVEEIVIPSPILDVDYYNRTDEGRGKRPRRKRRQGPQLGYRYIY